MLGTIYLRLQVNVKYEQFNPENRHVSRYVTNSWKNEEEGLEIVLPFLGPKNGPVHNYISNSPAHASIMLLTLANLPDSTTAESSFRQIQFSGFCLLLGRMNLMLTSLDEAALVTAAKDFEKMGRIPGVLLQWSAIIIHFDDSTVKYISELVRVYLSNSEQICHQFVEERRGRLEKLIEDKVRW
ncbi:hypothetical protein L1887_45894 [Cichorium endivia]|nr:hypothetical protein L1887_45894 [Cichorium endivia]